MTAVKEEGRNNNMNYQIDDVYIVTSGDINGVSVIHGTTMTKSIAESILNQLKFIDGLNSAITWKFRRALNIIADHHNLTYNELLWEDVSMDVQIEVLEIFDDIAQQHMVWIEEDGSSELLCLDKGNDFISLLRYEQSYPKEEHKIVQVPLYSTNKNKLN